MTPGAVGPTAPADAVRERNILAVSGVAHFMAHMYMLVFPSLALALRDAFAMPLADVLSLSFWMYLLYGLGALPAGILTDLSSPRLMLAICQAGMGACAVLASRAAGPHELRLALAGLGLFASIYHPAGMALISRGVRRRGWGLGINGIFGNLGVVCAPFATGLLAVVWGWRQAYLVLAIPSLLGAALMLLPTAGGTEPERPVAVAGRRTQALRFAVLCAAMMLGGISYRGQTLVLPAFFEERISLLADLLDRLRWLPSLGTKTLAATALTSVAYLAGAAGQALGGHLADRRDLRAMYILFQGLSLPFLLALAWTRDLALLACALGYAFFAFGMQPIENSLVAVLTPPRLRSTGYGLKFILTFGVGSLAVHMVGVWQRHGGLAAVFPWLAGCVFLLIVFASVLWWMTRGEPMRGSV